MPPVLPPPPPLLLLLLPLLLLHGTSTAARPVPLGGDAIQGPYSGVWALVAGGASRSDVAGLEGLLRLGGDGAAAVQLRKPVLPQSSYALRCDIRRGDDFASSAYGFNVSLAAVGPKGFVTLWYIELLHSGALSVYRTLEGTWGMLVSASVRGFPNATKFTFEVHATPTSFNATVTADNGTVVLSTPGDLMHDEPPAPARVALGTSENTVVYVDQVFVSRPLVPPLNRSSADQPNARKAVAGARVEGWEVEDGRIFLRHSSTVSNKDGNRSYSMPDTDAVFFVAVATLAAEKVVSPEDPKTVAVPSAVKLISSRHLSSPSSSSSSSSRGIFEQRYSIGDGHDAPTATLQWSLQTTPGCTNVSDSTDGRLECSVSEFLEVSIGMASVVATVARREYRLTVRLEPTSASFEPQELLSFRQRFDSVRGTLPLRSKVSTLHPVSRAVYGTERMSLLRSETGATKSIDPSTGVAVRSSAAVQLYIPVLSLFGQSTQLNAGAAAASNKSSGLLLSADPRSSFVFAFGPRGLSASRLFFLSTSAGAADNGYHNGDVNTTYVLRLGLPVGSDGGAETNWAALFAHYRAANPWMSAGQELAPGLIPPGGQPLHDSTTGEDLVSALALCQRLHSQYLGVGNLFYPENDTVKQTFNSSVLATIRRAGLKVHVWTNIRMACNTTNIPAEDPLMDYRLFNDSLQRDAKGHLLPCWDGFSMNPSPSVGSFGRFQLARIAAWVTRHNLDGVFLDFYGDTTMVDDSRGRGQFPFWPMQDAEVEFTKAVAGWVHARGKYLIINCPAASMVVQHIADLVTCDSTGIHDHWSMSDRLTSLAYGKQHVLLPQLGPPSTSSLWMQNGLRSLFYGEVPDLWQTPDATAPSDAMTMESMAIATYPLARMIAAATPLGGDFTTLWYRAAPPNGNGSAFIALNNGPSKVVEEREVSLAGYHQLPMAEQFEVVLWDGLELFSRVTTGTGAALSKQVFKTALEPNSTRVFAFVPPGVLL